MDWDKIKAPWIGVASGTLTAVLLFERIIGLAGLREDLPWVFEKIGLLPSWVLPVALTAFAMFALVRWGHYIVAIMKFILGDSPIFLLTILILIPISIFFLGFGAALVIRTFLYGYAVSTALRVWDWGDGSITWSEAYTHSLEKVGLTLPQD